MTRKKLSDKSLLESKFAWEIFVQRGKKRRRVDAERVCVRGEKNEGEVDIRLLCPKSKREKKRQIEQVRKRWSSHVRYAGRKLLTKLVAQIDSKTTVCRHIWQPTRN